MENAELYSTANGMQKRDAKEIFAEFRNRLKWPKKSRILDIGCGSGEVTTEILLPLLPQDFRELIGLDISLEMIQHARNLHSHPKVSFIQFDIAYSSKDLTSELKNALRMSKNDSLDIEQIDSHNINIYFNNKKNFRSDRENNQYDIVSSFYCLHWIPDQRVVIRNIWELLCPGGEALLIFLAKSPIFTLYRKLCSIDLWKDYMQDVDSFIPVYQDSENPLQKFLEIVKIEGFKVLTAECRERSYAFENVGTLRNAIKAVNPFLPRIPSDLQEQFINDCLHQVKSLKLTEFKNNCYRVNYKLIVAHIRKPIQPLNTIN